MEGTSMGPRRGALGPGPARRGLIGDLRRSSPGIRIMVLSATIWSEHVEDVLRAGADEVRDKIMSYWSNAEEVRRLAGR